MSADIVMEATARVLQARDRIIWNDPPPPPGKPRRDDWNNLNN
jgi:hypothetical protein